MLNGFVPNLCWALVAGVLGFAVAGIFAGILRLPRKVFLIAYLLFVAPFIYAFMRRSNLDMSGFLVHNWVGGLIVAAIVGAFLVRNILSQPISPRSKGFSLVVEIAWLGVIYGTLDALLLSVLTVVATFQAFSAFDWAQAPFGRLAVAVIALIVSLLVTVIYHLGYPEYRVPGGVAGPSVGNTVISLGYILANNPISAVFSHVAMHIAGILHGPATVMQLPPHYQTSTRRHN